jgi:hypothetical protein
LPFDASPPQFDPSDPRANERQVLGFCTELLQEANLTVRQCEGWSKIEPTMRAIAGCDTMPVPKGWSSTRVNEMGRVAEIVHANLTDTKPNSEFRTHNSEYESQAMGLSKMHKIWYYNRAIDQKYGSVIDYAQACASGYSHQVWNGRIDDIDCVPYDGRDVLPVDSFDNTVQGCWGVFIRRAVPLRWAQAMFPHLAARLEADAVWEPAVKLYEMTREAQLKPERVSPYWGAQNAPPEEQRGRGIRTVHLYWFYFNDPAINNNRSGGSDLLVGDFDERDDPITNYSYRVGPGQPKFPRKRLIIHSNSVRCYDGPNHYWHGMFPVSKYTMLPWPWTWLGATPMWDCLPLQDSLNHGLRVLDQHIRKFLRPPVSGDQRVGDEYLRRVSELLAGPGGYWRNPPGSEIKVELIQPLDQAFKDLLEICFTQIPRRVGVDDVQSLLGLGQVPEADSVEKLMFAATSASRLRSRMLELFYREQGRMFSFNVAQFYSVRRKFRLLGREGVSPTDYDYDPASFLPNLKNDKRPRVDIAHEVVGSIEFWVEPSSLLRTAAQGDRAEALALFRLGAIDIETLLERMDYQNIKQVMSRLEEQMKLKLQMAAAVGGPAGGTGGDVVPQRPMGGAPQGRPPTDQTNPQLNSQGYVDTA